MIFIISNMIISLRMIIMTNQTGVKNQDGMTSMDRMPILRISSNLIEQGRTDGWRCYYLAAVCGVDV